MGVKKKNQVAAGVSAKTRSSPLILSIGLMQLDKGRHVVWYCSHDSAKDGGRLLHRPSKTTGTGASGFGSRLDDDLNQTL